MEPWGGVGEVFSGGMVNAVSAAADAGLTDASVSGWCAAHAGMGQGIVDKTRGGKRRRSMVLMRLCFEYSFRCRAMVGDRF